jgi:hypothetical protein
MKLGACYADIGGGSEELVNESPTFIFSRTVCAVEYGNEIAFGLICEHLDG